MYTSYFGLDEKPFSITPDPRYLYLSERHADALAHLLYGITESGGFIQLTGEVGTGKTTLVRSILEQLPENVDVALILNPRLSSHDFLRAICQELHIEMRDDASDKGLVDALNARLLDTHARGRRVVLMVDEAQNLAADVLEQVRLLTNLETSKQKLLQIILVGQPELRHLLARNDLRQLAQRITGRFHLQPLDKKDVANYLRHRLSIAGAGGEIFRPSAIRELYRLSGGIPRIINVIADRALLGAYTRETRLVSGKLIREAAAEVHGRQYTSPWLRWTAAVLLLGGTAALALGVGHLIISRPGTEQRSAATPAPPEPVQQEPIVATAVPAIVDQQGILQAEETPVSSADLFQETLENLAPRTDTDTAFGNLFGLWGREYRPDDDAPACQQALAQGLQCIYQRGSWAQLRSQNRPAILTLIDDQGLEYNLVLTAMTDENASILAGDKDIDVPIEAISRYWFGDYLLLWQPLSNDGRELRLGMRGTDVIELRRMLDQIMGRPNLSGNSDTFDQELQQLVREFQRNQRLRVDGIAGTQTLMALAGSAPDASGPVLIKE